MCNSLSPRCLSIALSLIILVTACRQRDQQLPGPNNNSPLLNQSTGPQDLPIVGGTQADRTKTLPNLTNSQEKTDKYHDSKETPPSSPIQKLRNKAKEIFSSPNQDTPLREEQARKAKEKEEKARKKKEEQQLTKEKEARKQEEERKKKEEAEKEKATKKEEKKKKKEQEARKKEEKKKKEKDLADNAPNGRLQQLTNLASNIFSGLFSKKE